MEENDNMEFLEDLEIYNEAMENAYLLITKEKTVDDIYYEMEEGKYKKFYLPFDPIAQDGRDTGTIDLLIEHYEELEEYEKCANLSRIKKLCLNKRID
tara:strand:+ start:1983 stop:2276 length:294 start_codon:yes stop_codon:yes gene_type:complete